MALNSIQSNFEELKVDDNPKEVIEQFYDFFNNIPFIQSLTKEETFKFGETNYQHNKIKIATKTTDGKSLSEKTIKLTLLHEIMHAICGTGQYNDYSNDEPFIEWLANCIYSLKEQGKL